MFIASAKVLKINTIRWWE